MDLSFGWNHQDEEEKVFKDYYFKNDVETTPVIKDEDLGTTTSRTRRVTITEIIDEHENWNLIGDEQVSLAISLSFIIYFSL